MLTAARVSRLHDLAPLGHPWDGDDQAAILEYLEGADEMGKPKGTRVEVDRAMTRLVEIMLARDSTGIVCELTLNGMAYGLMVCELGQRHVPPQETERLTTAPAPAETPADSAPTTGR